MLEAVEPSVKPPVGLFQMYSYGDREVGLDIFRSTRKCHMIYVKQRIT